MNNTKLFKKALELGLSVVYFDIETSPYLVYAYGLWKSNISHSQIIVPMQVTSISWLWEGDKEPQVMGWDDSKDEQGIFNILKKDRDRDLLRYIAPEVASADIIIGQNSDSYDIKKVNWRLNELGLSPIKNLITLDTLKLSRKVFSPPSHKLDYRSQAYGFGGKIKQDMTDCINTAMGHKKTQKLRMEYNKKDVEDTRRIFWRELDSYILPKSLEKMLREYTGFTDPYCENCEAKKQRKYDFRSVEMKGRTNYKCNRCDHKWSIKK